MNKQAMNDREILQRIGTNIRTLRIQRGMTITECARRAGLHPQTLSRYENGEGRLMLDGLIGIADALGISILRLLP